VWLAGLEKWQCLVGCVRACPWCERVLALKASCTPCAPLTLADTHPLEQHTPTTSVHWVIAAESKVQSLPTSCISPHSPPLFLFSSSCCSPAAHLLLTCCPHQVVAPYAKAVINAAYASDKAVADDLQVQAFAAALTAPHGSNLVRINDAGSELKTRAQLAKFIEDYVASAPQSGQLFVGDLPIL